jgi:energy-converting hydrogenase Eha subunit A
MNYTTERINGGVEQFESFTEADQESIVIEAADLEELESLESLESLSIETVAEDLEGYMEGVEERATPGSYVNKRLLKVFTALVRASIKKIMNNPKTRAKLQAAARKGPDAVTQLLLPTITKAMPVHFNWMPAVFVPPIVARLLPAIGKQAGLKPEEMAGAEWWGIAIGALSLIPSLFRRK